VKLYEEYLYKFLVLLLVLKCLRSESVVALMLRNSTLVSKRLSSRGVHYCVLTDNGSPDDATGHRIFETFTV